MKLLLAFVSIAILSTNSAYVVNQIPGIEGINYVKQIEFDSNSNTYVVTRSGGESGYDRLFKLDNSNSITLTQDFYLIWKILINSKNDVYIFSSESQPDNGQYSVHLLKSDSNEALFLFKFFFEPEFSYPPFFIDSDDYIFFNTASGAALLKPEQNIPLAINYLEGWHFDLHSDTDGLIVLANNQVPQNPLAILTREIKEDKVPTAWLIPYEAATIPVLKSWDNNGSVIFGENFPHNKTELQSSNGGLLLSQYNVHYTLYEGTDERFIFLGSDDTYPKSYHLHFVTTEGNVVKIEENLDSSITRANGIYATDKDGNAFIAITENKTDYQVLLLRADEERLRRIRIPTETQTSSLMVDESDNLWVLAGELFVVLKGAEEAVLVSGTTLTEAQPLQLNLKKGTDQIYISSYTGVFLCTNNEN